MMATRIHTDEQPSLDLLLASVPSLPRPILARLTARMIERLDELDDEAVFETHEECRHSLQPQRIRLGRADEARVVAIKMGRDLYRRRCP